MARPRAARSGSAATAQTPRARSAVGLVGKTQGKQHKRIKLGDNTPIILRQRNPKRANTVSYGRFERYKHAKTRGEFGALGGIAANSKYDVKKGFITVG